MPPRTFAIAMTGASGAPYGLRLLEHLLAGGHRVYLLVSAPGRMVVNMETPLRLPAKPSEARRALLDHLAVDDTGDDGGDEGSDGGGDGEWRERLRVLGLEDWSAPVASGSNPPDAMVVCPCTSGTLAAIASGHSRNLIDRAADVVLKEGRKLVLAPREMPFSVIHLENMLRLARAGAVIMPPNPGFYHAPERIEDLVDFVVARILDHVGVTHALGPRWGQRR